MIDWIGKNIVQILAVIGSLYSVARIVVALTPTPQDDIALAKISVLLKVVGKVAGLDLKQGISKTDAKKEIQPSN